MSRFYVGQRVRVARDLYGQGAHNVGKEGVITDMSFPDPDGYCIEIDTLPDDACHPDELEPILYDGNQLVSWESMKDLWTPAGGVTA